MSFMTRLQALIQRADIMEAELPNLPPEERKAREQELKRARAAIESHKKARKPQDQTPEDDWEDWLRKPKGRRISQ